MNMPLSISDLKDATPVQVRHAIREGRFDKPTSGLCPGFAQANLIVLPKEDAYDFLLFAQRNPKPCPLLDPHGTRTNQNARRVHTRLSGHIFKAQRHIYYRFCGDAPVPSL